MWFGVIANSLVAFGPIAAIAILLVSKRSHLSIISVVGAFAWMLSNVISAVLWVAIPPLKASWLWVIPSGVVVQEIMRYGFYCLYARSEKAIVKAMHGTTTQTQQSTQDVPRDVPLNDLSSSFSSGVGYGLMQSIVVFGSVLENGFGDGTYYTTSCSAVSLFTLTAFTTCFVSIMQISWMIIAFNGYRNISFVRIFLLFLLHLGSSMTSLLNQQKDMCGASIGIQCGLMCISVACAVFSQRHAVLTQGTRVREVESTN
jgi:anterior pharynx defective protein 1